MRCLALACLLGLSLPAFAQQQYDVIKDLTYDAAINFNKERNKETLHSFLLLWLSYETLRRTYMEKRAIQLTEEYLLCTEDDHVPKGASRCMTEEDFDKALRSRDAKEETIDAKIEMLGRAIIR